MNPAPHRARKRFGQNFLTDGAIIDAIVRAIAPRAGERMVEIGPGLAALTQPLVERLGHLTVIELDRDLAARLRQHPQLTVVEADVLRVDFAALAAAPVPNALSEAESPTQGAPDVIAHRPASAAPAGTSTDRPDGATPSLRIVGNLPYNISSPILFHLLPFAHLVVDQHFMLQKEVVDRMVAGCDHADYGRLSVMLQWRYAMDNVLHVPPESFDPAPRVDSAIVRMRPHAAPAALDPLLLEDLVRAAFSQRRKLLRHSLGAWLDQRLAAHPGVGDVHFDLQRRAQEVPVAEFVALAQQLSGPAGGR